MDNAIDKLKAVANTTTKSNKESGVAHYHSRIYFNS